MLSAAIDKYVYIAVNSTFTDDYLLKYSAHERVGHIEDIDHALIREVLSLYRIPLVWRSSVSPTSPRAPALGRQDRSLWACCEPSMLTFTSSVRPVRWLTRRVTLRSSSLPTPLESKISTSRRSGV